MEDWTEKYRPKNLDNIIGNDKAINFLRNWANDWQTGKKNRNKAVILSGKPGTGKTSSALALANDFNWITIELNASDVRNAEKIKKIATSGALNETFDDSGRFISSNAGGRKLIILDEADNLYERVEKTDAGSDFSDKGGKKAIIDTIKISNQPIILIVNDFYSLIKGSGNVLRNICNVIQFYDVNSNQIFELLKNICKKEDIIADLKLLQAIAERSKGDVRSAVNDLQSICLNRTQIDMSALDSIGYRNRERIIFDVLRDVFKTKNLSKINENMKSVDIPPETFLLWLSENLPREYIDTNDLVSGYDALSKADIFFGRVFKRQYYGFWSYACDLMNGGVSSAKTHNYGNTRYYPPTWMKRLSQSKQNRAIRDAVLDKLGKICHNSNKKSKEFLLPYFKFLFQTDINFAIKMKKRLDLTESDVKFLLGEKHLDKLDKIMKELEIIDESQVEIKIEETKEVIKEEKKEVKPEIKQPSLFDF